MFSPLIYQNSRDEHQLRSQQRGLLQPLIIRAVDAHVNLVISPARVCAGGYTTKGSLRAWRTLVVENNTKGYVKATVVGNMRPSGTHEEQS